MIKYSIIVSSEHMIEMIFKQFTSNDAQFMLDIINKKNFSNENLYEPWNVDYLTMDKYRENRLFDQPYTIQVSDYDDGKEYYLKEFDGKHIPNDFTQYKNSYVYYFNDVSDGDMYYEFLELQEEFDVSKFKVHIEDSILKYYTYDNVKYEFTSSGECESDEIEYGHKLYYVDEHGKETEVKITIELLEKIAKE